MEDTVWHRIERALARVRPYRRPLSLVVDGLVVAVCWNVTYLFRLGFERWLSARPDYDPAVLVGVVATYLVVFAAAGVPRGMWRFSGFGDIKRLTLATLVAGVLSAAWVMGARLTAVPRAVLALHPVVTLMGVCMVRVGYRMLYEHGRARIAGRDADARRAIVMGAGEAAKRLLATIHHEGWVVVGLLDDDPAKRRARIGGFEVVGALADVAEAAARRGATHVIVALPGARPAQRRRAIDLAAGTGLPVLTVPSAAELQDGSARIERVRNIEPDDLLGREPVALDEPGIAGLLRGKVVMVTGAGGSIGAELTRQVARYRPASLVLYELSEFALYQVEQQLADFAPDVPVVRLIGDVKDAAHVRAVCERHRPQVVFHAAAFKHVPLMEEENAWAALQNNVVGTWNAARAAAEAGAERFVLVSTDKAVNPTNVMGASKRAAEMLLSVLAARGHATVFAAVRFGNVLGSSGSVIPKFKDQILRGGPVTVTHPEMTRYFMTVSEASGLVLQAAVLARSGEVYVLDMGEPVRIVELARQLIRMSGHHDGDIRIVFSGPRPGEKLQEELLADTDRSLPSPHPRLRIAALDDRPDEAWATGLLAWLAGCMPRSPADARRALRAHVPEYRPPETAAAASGSEAPATSVS